MLLSVFSFFLFLGNHLSDGSLFEVWRREEIVLDIHGAKVSGEYRNL